MTRTLPLGLLSSDASKRLLKLNTKGWAKGDKAKVLHTNKCSFWKPGYPTHVTVTEGVEYDVLGVYLWNDHVLVLLLDDDAEATAYSECRLERIPA